MKINVKLFLLTFTIITFVSVTSAFIYHTLAQQLLQTQQSKALINSANDFVFAFQELIETIDDDFNQSKENNDSGKILSLDFQFKLSADSSIADHSMYIRKGAKIFYDVSTIQEFMEFNTNLIFRYSKKNNDRIYYGIQVTESILNKLSEEIRAEVALVEGDVVTKISNNEENQYYLPYLSRATRELKEKNNFELLSESVNEIDFSVTHYSPKESVISNKKIDFLIFSGSNEAAAFKDTMNIVTAVIVISGIFLTIIFLLLFTTKFRKQLALINEGVKKIAKGVSNDRVKVISKDEIGELGNAFNNMLEEIERRDLSEKEYSEFISLINQNPSLEDLGKITLSKIISTSKVDVGAFYLYDENELVQFAEVGLFNQGYKTIEESVFYKRAKEKREVIEIHFSESHPIIKTGITELKINYMFILPIFYNNEIIAFLELASVNKPNVDVKIYLNKIKNQLAIGLANAKAFSELKKIVNELQKLNNAYQKQNIEITNKNKELLQLHEKLKKGSEELEIQTKKAINSEKLKSQFLTNMSHELRTPQNSILGLTELIIKDETTNAKTRERLNVVLRNGKKLLTLIENILEYSKLESGNTEIVKSKIKLSELIDEVYTYIYPLFLEREIEFSIVEQSGKDFEIFADIKKIEQIIFNLVGNAAKFTKEGYVKLSFIIEKQDLKIIVEDTGPGITEDEQSYIFDEFRQTDANLNRKFSGTGLGLAICKKYTELMNGEINVESGIDKGSAFKVFLPEIVKSEFAVSKEMKPEILERNETKAVIISDKENSTKLISDFLNNHNCFVEIKNSLNLNLDSIIEVKPDILIVDILNNNMDGFNFIAEIKSNPTLQNVPVVVVNMDEDANCGLGLNIFEYIAGELNKEKIQFVIDKLEEKQGIKFRKLFFLMPEEKYSNLEEELLPLDLKLYYNAGTDNAIEQIRRNEPDLIFLDLYDPKVNPIKILTDINEDLYTKNIPAISFIKSFPTSEERQKIESTLFETTLIKQYHPLDVLKIIKDRIELFNNNVFEIEPQQKDIPTQNENMLENRVGVKNEKAKILIVDDDSDARFTIGEITRTLGYEPYFATNGYDCLEKLNKELPDLVLLDIMMPKMDGFQTIKKIREDERFGHLEVYALTAYAMLSNKEIIEKNGFSGLITKPINTIQLERKLNQIFTEVK